MFPKYKEIELPLLFELMLRGGSAKPSDKDDHSRTVYDALADYFDLSAEARETLIYEKDGTPRKKWHNMVRWARRELKDQELLVSPRRGVWQITQLGVEFASKLEDEAIASGLIRGRRKIDLETFRKMQQQKIEIGEEGEHHVLEYEKERLCKAGRKDLADKVFQVSAQDVTAGYDIESFETSGEKKFIEVKASLAFSYSFELSRNELAVAQELRESYWIYKVMGLRTSHPNIHELRDPASMLSAGQLILTPLSYRVNLAET
ncbi:MAG: DUF3883 domain-containing protein [Trueperaceae bacterium]|nr:DUF3883 domain-containing protein [Trueperaceae bacterium]